MNEIKMEISIIIFSILLLLGLGIRAKAETEIVKQRNHIEELQMQIALKNYRIVNLQEELKPLPYSQPLKQIRVSSITGIRTNPLGGGAERLHQGYDLIGEVGDSVDSVLAGRVVENWIAPGWKNGILYNGHPVMGGYIVIDHGSQVFSLYGHLSKSIVREGQWIGAGEKIGELGNTGVSTGPHLHFSIVLNPFGYLKNRR